MARMKTPTALVGRPSGITWLLLAAPAILLLLHTLYWQWTRRALEDGLQAWTARRIAAGWRIEAGPPAAGGWPLAVTLTLADLVVTAPDQSGWAGERLVLQVNLLHPDRLIVDAPGAQRLIIPGAQRLIGAGAQRVIVANAQRLHLELPLAGSEAPAAFSLAATDIFLPPSVAWPLGPSIASLSAAGWISHVTRLPEAAIATQARQWRDRGGEIDLAQFALVWGPLDLSGKAVVALDERLRPKGDATARIAGFPAAIARLAEAGTIAPQTAMLATAALTMLSDPAGTAEVPLHLEAGRLSLRQIPLLTVPEFAWPSR